MKNILTSDLKWMKIVAASPQNLKLLHFYSVYAIKIIVTIPESPEFGSVGYGCVELDQLECLHF